MANPPFDNDAVKDWLKLTRDESATLNIVVPAVQSYVDSLPSAPRDEPVPPALIGEWTAGTYLAALMLAAKLYGRRNSPNGVQAFGDAGVVYAAKSDPEIARLLRIDAFTKPQVG